MNFMLFTQCVLLGYNTYIVIAIVERCEGNIWPFHAISEALHYNICVTIIDAISSPIGPDNVDKIKYIMRA